MNFVDSSKFEMVDLNPNPQSIFRESWGAKTPGLVEGNYLDGIIIGFQRNEKYKKNNDLILKCFQRSGRQILIWSCSWLNNELFTDETQTQLRHPIGSVIRVIYLGSYPGTSGMGEGKLIGKFKVNSLRGYQLTNEDKQEIYDFQAGKPYFPLQSLTPHTTVPVMLPPPSLEQRPQPISVPQQIQPQYQHTQQVNLPYQQQQQQSVYVTNNNQVQPLQQPPVNLLDPQSGYNGNSGTITRQYNNVYLHSVPQPEYQQQSQIVSNQYTAEVKQPETKPNNSFDL